jgi:hypothetical protein
MRIRNLQRELPNIPGHRPCRCVNWTPWNNPATSLAGYATVSFVPDPVINRMPIFRGDDSTLSVGVPSIPEIGADGKIKIRDGKRVYHLVLSFACADDREWFSRAVLGALAEAGVLA